MTASGIPYFVVGVIIISMIYIALGPAVDVLNEVHNQSIRDTAIPMSKERADAWTLLMMVHDNLLLITLIGFIILLVLVSLSVHTGPTY